MGRRITNMTSDNSSVDFTWSDAFKNVLKSSRKLRISRHGESVYNVAGLIGGNPELSSNGEKYATSLANKVNNFMLKDLQIWTSELIRTQQTARFVKGAMTKLSDLNEISSGDHDSMTYEEIEKYFPTEYAARDKNKLTYRYPNGESYLDVCRRIERVLTHIDSSDNLLIISHQAVIRCLLGAILNTDFEQMPFIKVPLHTLIEVDFFEDGRLPVVNYIPLHIDTSKEKRGPSMSVSRSTESAIAAH
uniref:6phosphofructo2kinase/fructose-2, 6-bisphosphatase short form-like [Tribolium castaneum] n=1 Tax=Lepeophtheirus salmonis TaxID=72036 RepID=A0A0K2T5R2_LEPSM